MKRRAEEMRKTAAGIRGGTLIINLPGSERAARENFAAIRGVLDHAVEMLRSGGSADCAG